MLQFLKRLFSSESQPSIDEMMSNGGVIVDVRSAGEYAGGHVKNSINIQALDVSSVFNFERSSSVKY